MSFQLLGQVIGASFGPFGAIAGSLIGGEIDRAIAPGPDPGDLAAPSIGLGTRLPRVYGTVRVPLHPSSWSDYRATEEGGKGSQPTGFSYSLDMLGAVADGTNVLAVTRVWVNKKLSDTRHASSSLLSVTRSIASPEWCTSWTLYPGGPSQTPPPLYEDRVGTANAPAQRGYCTIEIADLKCGGAKAPPAIEVELITSGTPSTIDVVTRLRVAFDSASAVDSSYFNNTPTLTGTMTAATGGVDTTLTDQAAELYYSSANLVAVQTNGWTVEAVVTASGDWTSSSATDNILLGYGYSSHVFQIRGTHASSTSYTISINSNPTGNVNIATGTYGAATHVAIVRPPGATPAVRVYVNGSQVYTFTDAAVPANASGAVNVKHSANGFANPRRWITDNIRLSYGEIYTGTTFTPPADLPAADAPGTVYTPTPVTLSSIILAELGLDETFDPADVDVTDVADIMVTGFVAAGDANTTIAELCSLFFVDVVPGTPIKFVKRGAASVATIANADTGVAVAQPGQRFAGLKRENADETPAIAAVRFPLLERDHEAGYERGDRNSAESDDERRIDTRVVMSAAQAKGRALAFTLLDRVRRHKAAFALSDKYAALEPGDAYSAIDNDGNTARLNARRMSYADGVKQIEWELDDVTALVQTGITSSDYSPAYDPAPATDTTLYPLDIAILRDVDDGAGYYVAATGSDATWPGAAVYSSRDGVDYTQPRATTVTVGSVVGYSVTALPNWSGRNVMDESSVFTVDVGSTGTLASTTRDNVLDAGANAMRVGSEIIQFRDAALVSTGVYRLSGLLRGRRGTEWAMASHAANELVVMLQTSALRRIDVQTDEIAQPRYLRGVTLGRSIGTASTATITPAAVGLKPFAPVDTRKTVVSTAVQALLHFNGTDGSTTFTDVMGNTWTAAGNAQIDTAQSKYGVAAGLFDGTGDYVSTPSATRFNFADSNFTVQLWFRAVTLPTAGNFQALISRWGDGVTANRQFALLLNNNAGTIRLQASISTNGTGQINTHLENTSIVTGTWYHVALVRSGANIRLYLDGVELGSAYSIGATALHSPSSALLLGAVSDTGGTFTYFLNGYLDDVQLNVGEAVYTGAFTPPAAELPDPAAGDVTLTWSRRTRLAKNFSNGATPLGEDSEAYEVDIFADGTFAVVKRTLAVASASASYTAAQQVTDFGSTQSTIHFRAYQLSAIVGRGYAAQDSL